MARRFTFWTLLGALVFALAGCGGEGDSAEEKAKEKAKEAAEAASAPVCETTTVVATTKLPSSFPKPDGVTYRVTKTAGPSEVVDGTYDGSLDDAYDAYEQAVEDAGYNVLFKEKEENDAEISYEGEGTTGQIALRAVCGEDDRLVVHITNRPQ
jgi:hypothetical protein